MDLDRLRAILRPIILALKDCTTQADLASLCSRVCLPAPGDLGSKTDRLRECFDATPDNEMPKIAESLLVHFPPSAEQRNLIQDTLWEDDDLLEISKRTRHEIARALGDTDLFLDSEKFDGLMGRLWILDDNPFEQLLWGGASLRDEITQHVYRNPGDWDAEELFRRLGAFEASDRRFVLFLEGLVSADVNPDETMQHALVEKINAVLRSCGAQLFETGSDGGYPVFNVLPQYSATKGRAKNLIFASNVKPDLRLIDALNNDIEIVTNADKVLVYDRNISEEGLTWRILQSWWAETQGIADAQSAKKSLYERMRASLPRESSPPQRFLYTSYHQAFGTRIPDLPALLPEVWLHWDARAKKARGDDALPRCRMDFLMLLPYGVRVVLEVDGKHHYADTSGRADAQRYAEMVSADRELKLAGYHVFRFGADELMQQDSGLMVKNFFAQLFTRFGVKCSS